MNINKAVIKEYQDKNFSDIANAPVHALSGISSDGSKKLLEILGVKTVEDLAKNKFIKWAQAIVNLTDSES